MQPIERILKLQLQKDNLMKVVKVISPDNNRSPQNKKRLTFSESENSSNSSQEDNSENEGSNIENQAAAGSGN